MLVLQRLERIEAKLDKLITALAEEDEPERTLDGDLLPPNRNEHDEL